MLASLLISGLLSVSSLGAAHTEPLKLYDTLPSPLARPLHRTLGQGSSSQRVKDAQAKLVQLKMLPPQYADGFFNLQTEQAVRALQKASTRTEVDGRIGPTTWRALRFQKPLIGRWKDQPLRHAEVWLDRQLLVLVSKGEVVKVVQVSTGQPGLGTPAGTWQVQSQDADSYSVQYDAPMPWASYYNGGYAIHQSDSVPEYPASHGCTRVPAAFAKDVFQWLAIGTPVRIFA